MQELGCSKGWAEKTVWSLVEVLVRIYPFAFWCTFGTPLLSEQKPIYIPSGLTSSIMSSITLMCTSLSHHPPIHSRLTPDVPPPLARHPHQRAHRHHVRRCGPAHQRRGAVRQQLEPEVRGRERVRRERQPVRAGLGDAVRRVQPHQPLRRRPGAEEPRRQRRGGRVRVHAPGQGDGSVGLRGVEEGEEGDLYGRV